MILREIIEKEIQKEIRENYNFTVISKQFKLPKKKLRKHSLVFSHHEYFDHLSGLFKTTRLREIK